MMYASRILQAALDAPRERSIAMYQIDGVDIFHGQRVRILELKSRSDLTGFWAVCAAPEQKETEHLFQKQRIKVVTLLSREILSLSAQSLEFIQEDSLDPMLKHCVFSNETLSVLAVPGRGFGVRAMTDIRRGSIVLVDTPILSICERDESIRQDPIYCSLSSRMLALEGQADVEEELERCSVESSKRLAEIVFPTLSKSLKARWMSLHDAYAAQESEKTHSGIFQTNAVFSEHTGTASLFGLLSRINHGCMPNVYKDVSQKGPEIALKAVFDIPHGDELFLSYTPGDMVKPTTERRATLLRRYHFVCTCERCGPADKDTYNGPTAASLQKSGTNFFSRGQLPQACQAFHRALNCWDAPSGQERAKLLCHLSAAHLRIGDSDAGRRAVSNGNLSSSWFEKALEKAEEALTEAPSLWIAHRRKGDALTRMQRQSEATAAYSMADALRSGIGFPT